MSIRLEVEGPVGHVLIDRADKRNAFNLTMWEALPAVLDQAARNSDLRLLVLRSASPESAFCAGADIKELLANKDDGEWLTANQAAINRAQFQLTRHKLPTIAFVEGDCVGGGCGLALACDLRVSAPQARFGITPAKLGLVYPIHDVKLLIDLVGPGQAKRMLYTGNLIDADEALRIGLIEQITADPSVWIRDLVGASPHSIREMKRFVRRVLDGQNGEDEETLRIFAEAFSGHDFFEGTSAFVEKRKARFGT